MVDPRRRPTAWTDADGAGPDDGVDPRLDRPLPRGGRAGFRGEPRFEQRLDQWMTAGRQLVDGVSGARPGSRASSRLRPADLGRWVESKLDWLLEDDDAWREPWQERPVRPEPAPRRDGRRRPLEAISRRGAARPVGPAAAAPLPQPPQEPAAEQDWPDDASFSVSRWRRASAPAPPLPETRGAAPAPGDPPPAARAVPRSSRRRPG